VSTRTLVTKSATTLTAIQRQSATVAAGHYNPADIAALNALVINDQNPSQHIYQSLQPNGLLVVPNRGVLKVLAGDVVAVDLNGFPVVISAQSIAAGNAWTLT